MIRLIPSMRVRLLVLPLILFVALLLVPAVAIEVRAEAPSHTLEIALRPDEAMLTGVADLDVSRYAGARATVLLAQKAAISVMRVDGNNAQYERDGRSLSVDIPKGASSLYIEYACRFDDPVEEQPASMDNPGFGVMGSITDKGAFLLPGSDWYPWLPEHGAHYALTVRAPLGMYAVTTGGLMGHADLQDESLSRWDAWSPEDRLPLAAGWWTMRRNDDGPVPVLTYFTRQNEPLSARYLEATSRHVAFFSKLHGAYPFPQFSVVENYFPTGYGFPGFTLLGGRVLALPFIPETSLRHEVAHCWWGNGVLVDWERGNWCEGLTTYVADYLSKELESQAAALEYRIKNLRNYALVVPPDKDFALDAFTSRTSPATQAVGYGKAMYVFHMLRRRVGDEAFWQTLRQFYADHLFQLTSWSDFQQAFAAPELLGPDGAARFFAQWVDRPGAARLALSAKSAKSDGGWRVETGVSQQKPGYDLTVPVVVETADGKTNATITLPADGDRGEAVLETKAEPLRAEADPEANIFRRLAPEEVPATVNRLKGSENLVAILAESLPPEARKLAQWVLVSLSQGRAVILAEDEAVQDMQKTAGEDVLFFGMPESPELRALISQTHAGAVYLMGEGLPGAAVPAEADTVFFVDKRDGADNATVNAAGELPVTAMLAAGGELIPDAFTTAARKITHYGTYSYLVFAGGDNLGKGVWPVRISPMTVQLKE
ncbi:M1 family metallopeptidase [Oceanidesulfovibrio marinus]|uniref:M1 family metallopeptidase n=1 Tax=Oceanidesulfovibrio marinus TaxID=370038 RepID=A0ABX6NEV9_9BACT|nr:M1 family aminopeptidase [Oceanidesulfovibrio marinus]QJT09151.1 M1 family metallopeptidase [Oceanidesulfovibrio marinus]